jgi:type II secretory pathway pseudopilin PulG
MNQHPDRDDRGFTLIELLVYLALSVLVLGLVGGFLINSLTTERSVRGTTEASNSGQVAAQSISRGVRDALRIDVSSDGSLLRVLIVDDALATPLSIRCQAWYIADGELRMTQSTNPIPVPPGAAAVANWTLIAEDISAVGSSEYFTPTGGGASVDVAFKLAPARAASVLVETTARSRQLDPLQGAPASLLAQAGASKCF